MTSIRAELSRLLNTRCPVRMDTLRGQERSVVNFGMPDVLTLNPTSDADRQRLAFLPDMVRRVKAAGIKVVLVPRFPETQTVEAMFALEPHYVRASEPERNPKFPPLPGPAPTARLKDD